MQRYKSHKVVEAAKILDFVVAEDGAIFVLDGQELGELVTGEWIMKQVGPRGDVASLVGGYFVRYSDDYASWSPASAFEQGYTLESAAGWVPPGLLKDDELVAALAKSPAPRVTKEAIESRIMSHAFAQIGDRSILCQLILDNGYTVFAIESLVNAENFDPLIGERYAYDAAFAQLWPLFGFLLTEAQYQMQRPGFDQVLKAADQALEETTN